MLFLLLMQIAIAVLDFMFAPLNVIFPFEIFSAVYTLLDYVTRGLRFIIFFAFDASVLRSVFSFILTLNVILLGFDLIWRVISYVKLSRDG